MTYLVWNDQLLMVANVSQWLIVDNDNALSYNEIIT